MLAHLIDQDGDGFIDAHEHARCAATQAIDESVSRAAFEFLEADADGKVSAGDYSAALRHVWVSQNPAHPGTAMLGHS